MLMQKKSKFLKITLLVVLAGALCGLVYAVSVPRQYDSAAVLLPEASNTSASVTKLKSMSALVGSTLDFSPDALKPLFYGDVILSVPFLEEILDTRVSTLDGKVNTTLRDYLLNYGKQPWWSVVTNLPGRLKKALKGSQDAVAGGETADLLTEDEMDIIDALVGCLVADVSYITRRTIIRVRMQDPNVACQTVSAIIANLQRHIQDYRTVKNSENFRFMSEICERERDRLVDERMEYARESDANMDIASSFGKVDLSQKAEQIQMDLEIYAQMYLQCRLAQMNADSTVPAFRVLQPPMVVLKAAEPRIPVSMLRFSLVFLLVWILFYVIRRPWE